MSTTYDTAAAGTCTPAQRVTRSLLGYGVIAGPLYVTSSVVDAVTSPGFDLRRHQWSLLMLGEHGWAQVATFVVTGLMVVAGAVGLRRALAGGPGATWAPRLLAVYGACLVAAAVFQPDPALGYPLGTPEGPGTMSAHGLLHLASGGIGFTCFAAACFVLARRYAGEGRRGWARFSRVTGVVFLTGFAMIASTGGSVLGTLVFTAAVFLVWTWLSAVSRDAYRSEK